MARASGDTLGLGQLGYATGTTANVTTQTSLGTITGGTSIVTMDDYGIDNVTSITISDDTPDEGSTYPVTTIFSNAGSKFLASIGAQTRNFTWSVTSAP